MKWGEFRSVKLTSIIAPGDVRERQKTQDVRDLVADFKKLGGQPGNAIWAKKTAKGWLLVAGRDRYSALAMLGAKETTIHVVEEATPLELLDLEESENLRRRTIDRAALIASHVERRTKLIEAERAKADLPDAAGGKSAPANRPTSAKGEARAAVAKAAGTTPEAVRKVEQRVAAKEREGSAARTPTDVSGTNSEGCTRPGPPALIDRYGHPLPDRVAMGLGLIVGALKKAEQLNRQALAALGDLEMSTLDPAAQALVLDAFKAAGAAARAAMPTHLCPYCYGAAGAKCKGCKEEGWVTAGVFAAAPGMKASPVQALVAAATAAPSIGDLPKPLTTPRKIPPIKTGVTYTTNDAGDVVEQKPLQATPMCGEPIDAPCGYDRGMCADHREASSDIDRHIARAAVAKAPAKKSKPGPRIQIGDGPLLDIDEAEAAIAAMNSDDDRPEIDEEGVPF